VARPSLTLGLNQVIMMTLNMVIIASMIGAGGLGYDVLVALRRLDIGTGLEAGAAIVVLAVVLDRLGQAAAAAAALPADAARRARSRRVFLAVAAILAGGWIAAALLPTVATYPEAWTVTASGPLNAFTRWVNVTLYDPLNAIKTAVLLGLMVPVKTALLGLPWFTPPALAFLAGLYLGGLGLAVRCGAMMLAIMLAGLQQPAMTTLYLCGLGAFLSTLVGIPLGLWGARSETAHRLLMGIGDVLQTLPAFVYLIPVVMLFRVGDFSALVAIVAFAVVPVVRYTDFGIRRVPGELVEAGIMNGCTPRQLMARVRLPVAFPEILLGVNQTIMMALSMLVITALVGTRDLGQETYIALTKADTGRGLVAGLAIAFIAMTADRLIGRWAEGRRRALGLGGRG
jgi:glycine betaine/proline transport system permease protein